MRTQQRGQPATMGPGRKIPNVHQGDQTIEVYARTNWALLAPRGFTGGVHQSGSEFKRLNLQDGVHPRARSVPGADRVCSRARSAP